MTKNRSVLVALLAASAALATLTMSSCSKVRLNHPSKPFVNALQVTEGEPRPVINVPGVTTPAPTSTISVSSISAITVAPSVNVSVTLDKEAILNQQFAYGADLQYSSQYDESMDLYNQSFAVPVTPTFFRIAGDELELVTDNKLNFPSDVNHPEQVVSRFKILSQTDKTLTVSAADSRVTLATVFGPLPGSTALSVLDHWVRSFEYDAQDNIVLQQSSIVLPDGTIGEFMESIQPYSRLASGKDFNKIKMDAENPLGGDDDLFQRFRFLDTPKVFDGEDKLAYAQHFDISPKADGTPGTIDWYVTPNIPDQYILHVKNAIEGWNRYFRTFQGISRDVMQFKGKLPAGIHLGDPRYNVVNWDSRLVAGAAYESQSADPTTGRQGHSLIYMPAAWVQIGMDYWEKAQIADPDTTVSAKTDPTRTRNRLAMKKPYCSRNLKEAAELLASGAIANPEEFGIRLLKSTLFHEVGHALGLAHNFKGSLVNDGKPGSPFTSSIMDYNFYGFERAAFNGLETSEGPALEYDRQILSVLYNNSKDISDSDPVLPVCTDWEADAEKGGVDPFCARYDAYNDPTHTVARAVALINEASVEDGVTLTQALARVPGLFLTDTKMNLIQSQDDLLQAAMDMVKAFRGTLQFYYISGEHSIGRAVRSQVKMLLNPAKDAFPEGYNATEARQRVFQGAQLALSTRELPTPIKLALDNAQNEAWSRVLKSPYMRDLPPETATKLLATLKAKVSRAIDKFATDSAAGLPRLRAAVATALARHADVSPFLGKSADGSTADYETAIVTTLADVASDVTRTTKERTSAAKSLASYKTRFAGKNAINGVLAHLEQERLSVADADSRDLVESLITLLSNSSSASADAN